MILTIHPFDFVELLQMSTYATLYGVITNSSNFSCGNDASANASSIFGHVIYGGVPQNLLINFVVWVVSIHIDYIINLYFNILTMTIA